MEKQREDKPSFREFRCPAVREAKAMNTPLQPHDALNGRTALTLLCALYIALFCWLGLYARPSADDYNFANAFLEQGFFGMQKHFYLQWTGRAFNTFLLTLAAPWSTGPLYGLLPLATVLLSLGALYFCVHSLVPELSTRDKATCALLLCAASLSALPALNETLYWLSGMPYAWATALSLLALALAGRAFRENGRRLNFWSCALLLLLNGTLLEPVSVMQIVLTFLAALYFLSLGAAAKAKRAVALLLVALLAFLAMLLAPGTTIRMGGAATVAFFPRLIRTLGVAGVFGLMTVLRFFTAPIVWAFLLFLPSIAQVVPPLDGRVTSRLKAWHIVLLTALIAPLMQAVAGWGTGVGLPERAVSLTLWMMGVTWGLLWAFGYRQVGTLERLRSARPFRWRWGLLGLCLLLSSNFVALIGDLGVAPAYRAELTARDELVQSRKETGSGDVVVPLLALRLRLLFFSDLRPWSSDWKNQSYAAWNGVTGVAALPQAICEDERALKSSLRGDPTALERLAEAGEPHLQFLTGELYDTTFASMEGVAKDDAKAAAWYLRAAEQGDAHAGRRLARLYALGKGVPKSYLKALLWLLRSQL